MTVATYTLTNAATQTVTSYQNHTDGNFSVLSRLGTTFAPHAQATPTMTVALDAGSLFNGTTLTEIPAQNTSTLTAPTTNPRMDRVVLDGTTGQATIVTGTESATPVAPAIPSGTLPIAQILLHPTSTIIDNSMITDERSLSLNGTNKTSLQISEQTGTNYTYAASDWSVLKKRTNAGAAMADILPGTGSIMTAGWTTNIINLDSSALLSVSAGSGTTLKGTALGYLILGPNQQATIASNGTDYYIVNAPDRTRLGANTTLYVATTGSDTQTGLTATTPFQTPQRAIDIAANNIDLNGNTLTIQLADGTYTTGILLTKPFVGGSNVIVTGNASTPSNVIISVSIANGAVAVQRDGSILTIKNMKLQTTTNGGGLWTDAGGHIYFSNIDFGSCAWNHMTMTTGGIMTALGSYTISGGGMSHISCSNNARYFARTTMTVTVTGTPNFSSVFCNVSLASLASFINVTFSGVATGTRYYAISNSVITTNGAGANFFPGNVGGLTNTGGLYV